MKYLSTLLLLLSIYAYASSGYPSFAGSNLYYAAGLYNNDQHRLFSALQSANVKVLRCWIGYQPDQQKGTKIQQMNDVEPNQIGQYDDDILNKFDALMLVAHQYKVKLLITMHSFNALEANDVYGKKYGTGYFYEEQQAQDEFDNRLRHILTHTHSTLGKQWKDLSDYIFAFEAENEAMIGKGQDYIASHQYWQCDRANTIKSVLGSNSGILVTTGGESWLDESMQPDWFSCGSLDVLAIHGYGVGDFNTGKLQGYVNKAVQSGKKLIWEEWGACYFDTSNNDCPNGNPLNPSTRGNNIRNWAHAISAAGVPWLYWQVLPNNDPHYGYDYEIGMYDQNWNDIAGAMNGTHNYNSPFDWSPYILN